MEAKGDGYFCNIKLVLTCVFKLFNPNLTFSIVHVQLSRPMQNQKEKYLHTHNVNKIKQNLKNKDKYNILN